MKIGVVSPRRYSGATTAAVLIGSAIAQTQAQSVCLTTTGDTAAIKSFLNLTNVPKDPTRSLTLIARLLESKTIKASELEEYCQRASVNLRVLDSTNARLSGDEREMILRHVFANITSDVAICGITHDLSDNKAQIMLKERNIAIIATLPNNDALASAREWIQSGLIPKTAVVMTLMNNYQPEIAPLAELAAELGVKMRELCKLHQNPYIARFAWKRQSDALIPWIVRKDYRVIELNNDLRECMQFICSVSGRKLKWGE
jgi:hypothetical protein